MSNQVKNLQKNIDNALKDTKKKANDFGETAKSKGKEIQTKAADFAVDTVDNAKQAFNAVENAVGDGAEMIGDGINQAKKERDIKRNHPVFIDDLCEEDFALTHMLRLVDNDKRKSNKNCAKAVGFKDKAKEVRYLTICRNDLPNYNIKLHPDTSAQIYYAHPKQKNFYIDLDSYFSYIQEQSIAELQMIAQKLGASHFKVIYKEKKKSLVDKEGKAGIGGKKRGIGKAKVDVVTQKVNDELYDSRIAAELYFKGNSTPVRPELVFFKNNSDIEGLVEMRLDPDNTITSKNFTIEYKKIASLSEKTAAKLDAALNDLDLSGTVSLQQEVKREQHILLEYLIEF